VHVEGVRDERPDGWFRWFAHRVSVAVGSHRAFTAALFVVLEHASEAELKSFEEEFRQLRRRGLRPETAAREAAAELKK
jgi:hypothetical protein